MSAEVRSHTPTVVDVCLLVEGNYPYLSAGASDWLHALLRALPELRFSLVFLGGRRAEHGAAQDRAPPNLVHVEAHYLEDSLREPASRSAVLSPDGVNDVRALHAALERLAQPGACLRPEPELDRVLCALQRAGGLALEQFLYSPGAWGVICEGHARCAAEASFLDYFWSLRRLHAPLFHLARVAEHVPAARAYHAMSTGYAGFLGTLLACRRGRPLLLSEHGSSLELRDAAWIGTSPAQRARSDSAATLQQLRTRYFESLARLAYRVADPIVASHAASREQQIAGGAPLERTRVIAQGVDSSAFEAALLARPRAAPRVIGWVGPVVPSKDVKTFVQAIALAAQALPDVQGWIFGSTDEDPRYAQECKALVRSTGLTGRVHFFGQRALADVLPKLGVLMLSSIREDQPRVVLEAFASGLPCVVTDVGACRELIQGRDAADRALGAAGRVAATADTAALARGAVELLGDPQAWQASQFAALTRVRRHYAQDAVVDAYRALYGDALSR